MPNNLTIQLEANTVTEIASAFEAGHITLIADQSVMYFDSVSEPNNTDFGWVRIKDGIAHPIVRHKLWLYGPYVAPVRITFDPGSGGSTADRELVVTRYRAISGGSGYSSDNVLTNTRVYDLLPSPMVLVSDHWYNETTKAVISAPSDMGTVAEVTSSGLTQSQLQTMTVEVSDDGALSQLQSVNQALGEQSQTPATNNNAGWSVIQWLGRIAVALTTLTRGTGNTDANTQRVTLAADGPGVTQLTAISTAQTISVGTSQVVAIGATSTQSAVIGAGRNRVVLIPTVDCWVALGANPTAAKAAGSFFLAAGAQSYPISVTPGTTKIAVLTDASGATGSLSVIESV